MSKTRPELVDWVQARIDEFSPNSQSATISQPIIENELDESAALIIRSAKKQLIYPAGISRATEFCIVQKHVPAEGGDAVPYSVIIPLKSTFMRFLRVRLSSWRMPVDDMVSVDTNMYRHQYNKYQAATKGRPSVALIPFSMSITVDSATTAYSQAIELFPAPDAIAFAACDITATGALQMAQKLAVDAKGTNFVAVFNDTTPLISDLLVVEKTAAESMPESLIDPLIWQAAARCLYNLRLYTEAQAAEAKYALVMGTLLVGMKGEEVQLKG